MQIQSRVALFVILSVFATPLLASIEDIGGPQGEYEKEINAVVRNKRFYKTGHTELTAFGGTLPYDSVVKQTNFGGRLTWHLSDHFGWEVIDTSIVLPSVSNFATSTTQNYAIRRLDVLELKTLVGSNLIMSPFYGKIRFFGSQVVYFDIYAVAGLGMAQTKTQSLSTATAGGDVTETAARSGWDPMLNFGIGVKVFASRSIGVVLDLRDYLTYSEKYDSRGFVSNFAVQAGLSFFLPHF